MSDFTDKEKRVLLTETTGISIAVVVMLVSISMFIMTIKGEAKANYNAVIELQTQHNSLKSSYIGHTRIVDDKLTDVSIQLGELKGMMKIMLNNKNKE